MDPSSELAEIHVSHSGTFHYEVRLGTHLIAVTETPAEAVRLAKLALQPHGQTRFLPKETEAVVQP